MALQEGTYQLDSSAGWVRINTFKEGLLSRMGHDLTLEVDDVQVTCVVSGEAGAAVEVTATLPKDSIRVVGPGDLSAKDRAEIQKNLRKHLPGDPSFRGTFQPGPQGGRLQGQARVGGSLPPAHISAAVKLKDQQAEAEIELSHRALNLKPFRAPLGVIRLQDRVVLSFSLDLASLYAPPDA